MFAAPVLATMYEAFHEKRSVREEGNLMLRLSQVKQILWIAEIAEIPRTGKGDWVNLVRRDWRIDTEDDVKELFATIDRSGFDFENSPFKEVWLLSALFAWDLRLYPT
jgi:hypothetical protein